MRKFNLIALNKPFRVLSQFTDKDNRPTLSEYVEEKHFYPTGRLDYDSEGLLLLTCDGHIQSAFSHPENKINKYYWVQVEGDITEENCERLMSGVNLSDGFASAVKCCRIEDPDIWQRNPSVRTRKNIPTSWIEIIISEGRNRQVRRMTANLGFPTLRLIRYRIGPISLLTLQPGESRRGIITKKEVRNAS